MPACYSALGSWFEYLNGDCDYDKWSQYLLTKLRLCGSYKTGLDIGCGNGYFTRAFNKAGYAVDGVDVSEEMLSVARQKAAREGVRCEFLLGDIAKLKVLRKVDFITAVNDCINYVPPQELIKAFKKMRSALKPHGAFLFDISSKEKIENILGNNQFWDDEEDVTCLWTGERTENGIKIDITVFSKKSGNLYERADETQYQYAYSEKEIFSALKEAGFASAVSEGHLGSEDKSSRIQFIARV